MQSGVYMQMSHRKGEEPVMGGYMSHRKEAEPVIAL